MECHRAAAHLSGFLEVVSLQRGNEIFPFTQSKFFFLLFLKEVGLIAERQPNFSFITKQGFLRIRKKMRAKEIISKERFQLRRLGLYDVPTRHLQNLLKHSA